jgi:anti-sigma factor RsiW
MFTDPVRASLGAYLDGELPSDQAATVRQHISTCPECATEIAELIRLKEGLRVARNHYTPSAEFRSKMRRQIRKPVRPRWSLRIIPAALAAAAVLLISIAWTQYSHRADAFTEMADLHVGTLASTNPLDVVSTDRHTVKPWFQGRIPFSFNLPEFAGTGFTLLGGRVAYLHQQPGAQLIVGVRQHKISVLIFQDSTEFARAFATLAGAESHNSFNVETWPSRDLRFFVIGDVDPSEISRLSVLFRQAND